MNRDEYESHLQKLRSMYKMARLVGKKEKMTEIEKEANDFKSEWKDKLEDSSTLTIGEIKEIFSA